MAKRNPEHVTVTIPAFKEPDILTTLRSLMACDMENINLKVSILINCGSDAGQDTKEFNDFSYQEISTFVLHNAYSNIISVENIVFDSKDAGVGLARKTLMDKAANDFKKHGVNGIILALDADCTVSSNYLQNVSWFFKTTKFDAVSIGFAHPLEGANKAPITEYEYHLRYFINMQKYIGFPFAIQTIGSSMACFSDAYLARGGMNKRKAGEDFYFLHKFIKDQVCGEIHEALVFPSGRISDRVPFGTGRAVGKYLEVDYEATTYNPLSFKALKVWNGQIELYFKKKKLVGIDDSLKAYLDSINFDLKIELLLKNVSSLERFKKQFYQVFDAFQLMKCLHFMRESNPDISILEAAKWYNQSFFKTEFTNLQEALLMMRQHDAK